jgi:hypothetical protein
MRGENAEGSCVGLHPYTRVFKVLPVEPNTNFSRRKEKR